MTRVPQETRVDARRRTWMLALALLTLGAPVTAMAQASNLAATQDAAGNRLLFGFTSGFTSSPFATAEIATSHLRWQGELVAGFEAQRTLRTMLRLGYSPALEAVIDGRGGSAQALGGWFDVSIRRALQRQSTFLLVGAQAGAIQTRSAAAAARRRWEFDAGVSAALERELSTRYAVGLRSDLAITDGAYLRVVAYLVAFR